MPIGYTYEESNYIINTALSNKIYVNMYSNNINEILNTVNAISDVLTKYIKDKHE